MKRSKASGYGVCQLTGMRGKFVKSHLIPRALTRPEVAGKAMWQVGQSKRPTKRFDSWYDKALVTQDGEDILARIDDAAISELRKHKLVWSGWGPMQSLGSEHLPYGNMGHGIRSVHDLDGRALRIFYLSLLWRAAATNLAEFAEVDLPAEDLACLTDLLINGDPGPVDFYPVTLTQLSTSGMIHNLSPVMQDKIIPSFDGQPPLVIPIFRFYFDGLIAHIHRHSSDNGDTEKLGPIIVGNEKNIVVSTIEYDKSFEAENMIQLMMQSMQSD